MGYADEIRALLRPTGLYELDEGAGAAEAQAVGAELDAICERLGLAETEGCVSTAEAGGLSSWESVLPYALSGAELADRRRAIAALMRIDGRSFTQSALGGTLAGCGIRATVHEGEAAQTLCVAFPWNRGIPDGFDGISRRIGEILPCHLGIVHEFLYFLWRELEAVLPDWEAVSAAATCWDAFERMGGGD